MLLQEFNPVFKLERITEGAGAKSRPRFRGVFQRADEANKNKRIYSKELLERESAKLKELISENRLVGELDHPNYDVVKLQNASHRITDLHWKGNDLIGEMELLSTPAGKIAEALYNDGVQLGISSRALGSLSPCDENEGISKVNDDLDMRTYDLVADPSVHGAFPGITESVQAEQKINNAYKKVLGEKIFVTMLKEELGHLSEDEMDEIVGELARGGAKLAGKAILGGAKAAGKTVGAVRKAKSGLGKGLGKASAGVKQGIANTADAFDQGVGDSGAGFKAEKKMASGSGIKDRIARLKAARGGKKPLGKPRGQGASSFRKAVEAGAEAGRRSVKKEKFGQGIDEALDFSSKKNPSAAQQHSKDSSRIIRNMKKGVSGTHPGEKKAMDKTFNTMSDEGQSNKTRRRALKNRISKLKKTGAIKGDPSGSMHGEKDREK